MDETWKQARRNELWDTYVLKVPGFETLAEGRDRTQLAVEMLHVLRIAHEQATAEYDVDRAMATAARGRVVWQLLALEFGDWFLDVSALDRRLTSPEDWEDDERVALKAVLTIHDQSGPHAHRPALDPMPMMMPRWIVQQLTDGLDALDQGEVREILKPAIVGRHGATWTWDQMRACALEHVAYLLGQGFRVEFAQKRVADAMKVSAETLKSWHKTPQFRQGYAVAQKAGELKYLLDGNPEYAKQDGNTVDSEVLSRLHDFEIEPLTEFGPRYREQFGARHNQGPTGGN